MPDKILCGLHVRGSDDRYFYFHTWITRDVLELARKHGLDIDEVCIGDTVYDGEIDYEINDDVLGQLDDLIGGK